MGKVTSEQLDIWEHAALLYHSYEWLDAAGAFQHLARDISDGEARVLCSLNAAMIQARLGDYDLAAQTVEAAAKVDQKLEHTLIITPWLMGILDWQNGLYLKAEACLKVCLDLLRGCDVAYHDRGMAFTLRCDEVRRQLEAIKLRRNKLWGPSATIPAVMPAECIFEAPPRRCKCSSVMASSRTTVGPGMISTESLPGILRIRGLSSLRRPSTPPQARDSAERPPTPTSSIQSRSRRFLTLSAVPKPGPLRALKKRRTTEHEADRNAARHADDTAPRTSRSSSLERSQTVPVLQPQTSAPAIAGTTRFDSAYCTSWRQRPSTPYIARDARGEHWSTAELATFIRRYQHSSKPLAPRDARAQAENTHALAKYILSGGREESISLLSEIVGDASAASLAPGLMENVIPEEGDENVVLDALLKQPLGSSNNGQEPPTRHPSGSDSPVSAIFDQSSPGATILDLSITPLTAQTISAPASLCEGARSENESREILELLLPKVYDPSQLVTKPKSLGPLTPSAEPQVPSAAPAPLPLLQEVTGSPRVLGTGQSIARGPPNFYAQIHTAASSTSSLFADSIATAERMERARGATLQMLEGRARARPPRSFGDTASRRSVRKRPTVSREDHVHYLKPLPPRPNPPAPKSVAASGDGSLSATMASAAIVGIGERWR